VRPDVELPERPPLREPRKLRRLGHVGIGLIVATSLAGIAIGALSSDGWKDVPDVPLCGAPLVAPACTAPPARWRCHLGICDEQWRAWSDKRAENCRQRCLSRQRIEGLEAVLVDRQQSGFLQARQELDKEHALAERLEREARKQAIQPLWGELPVRVLLLGLDIAFALLTQLLLLRTGRYVPRDPQDTGAVFVGWPRVYAYFAGLGMAVALLTMSRTAFWESDKSWVAWDSFAVSPLVWLTNVGLFAGVVMIFAVPTATLWCLSRSAYVPRKLDPTSPDGASGVHAYVQFLHLWTILVFGLPLVLTVGWLRYSDGAQTSFDVIYLLPIAGGVLICGLLGGRLVRNALVLRHRYHAARTRLGHSWKDVTAKDPAPDPTAEFLGENWWRIPATLGGLFAALWGVLEWTKVAEIVSSALR
jgi:hypothetical protein